MGGSDGRGKRHLVEDRFLASVFLEVRAGGEKDTWSKVSSRQVSLRRFGRAGPRPTFGECLLGGPGGRGKGHLVESQLWSGGCLLGGSDGRGKRHTTAAPGEGPGVPKAPGCCSRGSQSGSHGGSPTDSLPSSRGSSKNSSSRLRYLLSISRPWIIIQSPDFWSDLACL